MAQQSQFFPARGGLDLITPPIELDPGRLIGTNNYEAHPRGYQRRQGYERFDGQQKPSTASYWYLNFDAGEAAIDEGDTVTGDGSGATGLAIIDAVVTSGAYIDSDAVGYVVLMNVVGTFVDDDILQVSAANKVTLNGVATERGALNDADDDTWLQDAMETARTAIGTVPGSGNMRGVTELNGTVYAFRDNAGATAVDMYKSSASGWTKVDLGFRIPFTSGGTTEISEGDTLTGDISGSTATLTRVALQSGSWAAGDAAGYFIMASASGAFQAEEVNTGLATIAADKVANTLTVGGRFDCIHNNFGGHSSFHRLYGCDGVSMAFEFGNDGGADVFVPIPTGMTTDTPNHIAVHRNHLFLSFDGGSVQHSGIGLPYQWTVITGAAELTVGEDSTITGMWSDVEGFLVIGTRRSISILYGQSVDNWELVVWSRESGIIEWSMQRLDTVLFADDIGVRRLSSARDYGNFKLGTLTQAIEPVFRANRKNNVTVLSSIRTKSKDMYRLFWSDKSMTSLYLGRGRNTTEPMGSILPITVECTWEGEDANGNEILFFGSTDGYVYELDAGPNNDGAEIIAFIRFPFNHVGSPSHDKQWFNATIEIDADPSVSLDLSAEYSYASDDQPPSISSSFTITGGGGFWDIAKWDQFNWSAPVEGQGKAAIDGLGTNVSIGARSTGTYDDPHTIHGLTLTYSMRRLKR
jgi:hypothetical protein